MRRFVLTPPLLLFVAFASLYLLTALGRIDSYDGEMMFRVTESMIERGSFVITDEAFHANEPYAVYGLGTSLGVIPLYLAARLVGSDPRWAASLFNPLVTAATVSLLWVLSRRLGASPRSALAAAVAFGLGTLAWPYTKTFFSEPLTGLLLVAAALAAHAARRGSVMGLVVTGLALGCAVLTREDSALLLPAYLVYAFVRTEHRPRLADLLFLGVPLAVLVALAAGYHELRFQSLFSVYAEKTGNVFAWTPTALFTGVYGQLLSSGKGLVFYSPIILLAPFAVADLWRRQRAECLLFAFIVLERFVFFSFLLRWQGGICWGPRYVVPTLPFLLVPLGVLLATTAWTHPGRRALVGVLLVLSIMAQLPGVAIFYTDVLDVALDERKLNWDQIHFVPAGSPLLIGWRMLLDGRSVSWLLPIADWARVLFVLAGVSAAAALARMTVRPADTLR